MRILFGALTVLSFTLISCSGGGGGDSKTEQVVGQDISGYGEASCQYSFETGYGYSRPGSFIQSAAFGKKYDAGVLNATMSAGGSEVVRLGQTTNVRFYQSKIYDASNCSYAASLPQAPYDLENMFSGRGEDAPLGLYLGKNTPGVSSTRASAAIVVRRDTNKWVLVHELMHHLFQLQVEAKTGEQDIKGKLSQAMKDYERLENAIERSRYTDRKEAVRAASDKLKEVNVLAVDFLKQYYLEEMAIETLLGDKLDAGQFLYVHPGQRINGAAYIVVSSKRAQELIDLFRLSTSEFILKYSYDLNTQDANRLREVRAQYGLIENEMSNLVYKASRYLTSIGLDASSLSLKNVMAGITSSEQDSHVGCSHSHEADEVYKIIMKK